MYKVNQIIKKIEKYNYISFDIFDTIIKRNIDKPSDIFSLVQLEYEKKYKCKIDNFKQIRILAEREARTLYGEPNINEIYKHIKLDKKNYKIEELMEIEINLEYKFCQLNKDFYPIYEYCIQNNKNIIITTDMYLNRENINNILKNAGIEKFSELFISSELKLNKHNGTIWKYIIKKLNIKPNQIIHIGDSKRGDWILPKFSKIKTIIIPNKINKLRYYNNINIQNDEMLQYDIIKSYINNNMDIKRDIYYKIGYETLGPILYGYSKWLINNINKNDIKKVFFLAREGALLKKAFDIINDNAKIDSTYICVSRKSTRPALLTNIDSLDKIYEVIKIKPTTNIRKFFKDLNLDYSKYKKQLKLLNCNDETKICEFSKMEDVYNLIKEDINVRAQEEEKKLLEYLRNQGFETNCAISDIGWSGSMQKALSTIYKQYDMSGYYIAQTNENKELNKNAYFSNYEELRPFVHLFENLFLAQHGTTLGYKADTYEPIFDKYEYNQEESNFFVEIQKGALDFVYEFNKSKILNLVDEKVAKINILKLGLNPTLKDIKLFENIPYIETEKRKLIETRKIIFYILNPKKFKEDFYNSGWKIGFLKKIIKINIINYYDLYKYGRRGI